MGLLEQLTAYIAEDIYPLHMPGHKRHPGAAPFSDSYAIDITEIDGFDNLHDAAGVLADNMARAARLWGSRRAFYLVNGSTGGLLAGITACTRRGDRVLVARNCHRAVYNALALNGLRPVYLLPDMDTSFEIAGSVSPDRVERALTAHPDIRLVVVTSPTYEGVLSDIPAIAAAAHRHGARLLVDEAHGAHLGLAEGFPAGSVTGGADIVVQSLHKTLPALTQTGLLHVMGDRVDGDEVARQLAVFETSSPSYPLMASISACVSRLETERACLFAAYWERLERFDKRIRGLRRLRVLCHGADTSTSHAFYGFDPGKLVISCRGTGLTGIQLAARLRTNDRLETEMAMADYVLAMTSICDSDEGFDRLADALCAIDAELSAVPAPEPLVPLVLPPLRCFIDDALAAPGRLVPPADAIGGISREYVWAYPPGIPLLVPGEEITPEWLSLFSRLTAAGITLKSTCGRLPEQLEILCGEY